MSTIENKRRSKVLLISAYCFISCFACLIATGKAEFLTPAVKIWLCSFGVTGSVIGQIGSTLLLFKLLERGQIGDYISAAVSIGAIYLFIFSSFEGYLIMRSLW